MCFWQVPHILQYASAVHNQIVGNLWICCFRSLTTHTHTDKDHYKLQYNYWSVKVDML